MKKKRDLYFYLGRDKYHNYPATKFGNMIVSDSNYKNQQVTSFTHNLLIKVIQEYNPRDIDITLVTMMNGVHVDFEIWRNALTGRRIIPQIKSILSFEEGSKEPDGITNLFKTEMYGDMDDKKHLVIIDWAELFFDSLSEDLKYDWEHMLNECANRGYYFVFITNDVKRFEHMLYTFDIKVSLKTTPELSMLLFESDIASSDAFNSGQFYIKSYDRDADKLYIPFYPDTWIEKFCRYYGVVNEEV